MSQTCGQITLNKHWQPQKASCCTKRTLPPILDAETFLNSRKSTTQAVQRQESKAVHGQHFPEQVSCFRHFCWPYLIRSGSHSERASFIKRWRKIITLKKWIALTFSVPHMLCYWTPFTWACIAGGKKIPQNPQTCIKASFTFLAGITFLICLTFLFLEIRVQSWIEYLGRHIGYVWDS